MRRRGGRTPPPEDTGPRHDWDTIRALLPYLWPKGAWNIRVRVVSALAFLLAGKATTVAVPLILKHAVDALTVPADMIAVPVALLVAYGAARVTAQMFRELQGAIFARVSERAIRDVSLKTFRHLHDLALRFHLDRQTGGLSRAIERGSRAIDFLLRIMLFNIVPTLLELGMVTVILWTLFDAIFAVVALGTIAAYVVWTLAITEWRTKFRRFMNQSDAEAHTKAVDSLLNYETVKYFNNEAHESARFDTALRAYEEAAVKSKVTLALLNVGQGAVIAAGVTVIMILAGHGVKAGTMTVGDFVLVNTYLIQLYLPLNFLGSAYREIKHSLTDMEAMFSLLKAAPEITDAPDAPALALNGAEVAFENVAFAYDPRRPVLGGVSFRARPGGTVAIVGASGAGKSTVSRLLYRFYDIQDGAIKIDGQDIRNVTQQSLRAAIGVVPQDTVLFNDTVYYNIAYGRPDATPAEVEEAARLAAIHDFIIGLPDGYQTRVGERGLKLSGGEKQRVAIARAILKRPAIMLFDEATSALDTQTEKEIQAALAEVSRGRTTLIIAHRLSTVVDADEILVLDAGALVERGTHAALLAENGAYAAMWARQQEAAEARKILDAEREVMETDGNMA